MLHLTALAGLAGLAAGQAASYTPTRVACPDNLITRTGNPLNLTQTLGADESAYLSARRQGVLPQLYFNYLADNATGETGYNASQLFASELPTTGITCSGGGLRASLYCAGTLSALDSRNLSTAGGLLQLADYMTGLSGGSWAVSSVAMNDLPPIYDLVLGTTNASTPGWKLDMSIIDPGGVLHPVDDVEYIDTLIDQTQNKSVVAPVSVTDVWGRALSAHFWNGTTEANFFDNLDSTTDYNAGLLWHSIRLTQNFQAKAMPFPIIVTTSRVNVSVQDDTVSPFGVIPLSNTQFSIDPYTFGSFDPTLAASIPLEYAGSLLNNGAAVNSTSCLTGFDNAGFMIGSSASLFNSVETLGGDDDAAFIATLDEIVSDLADIEKTDNASVSLVANWPNSFMNFQPNMLDNYTFESSANEILEITDGGENGENVPIAPLLVKARAVDFILATDASADTDYLWPNGTSIVATAQRVAGWPSQWASFPPTPADMGEFVAQGLNTRPAFFGCNTTQPDPSALGGYPLVVYLANAPPATTDADTYLTNVSTYQLEYDAGDVVQFLDAAHTNALKGYSQTNPIQDSEWPLCLKCAVVDRLRQRANVSRSAACESCFSRYCWNESDTTTISNNGSSGATGTNSNDSSSTGNHTSAAAVSVAGLNLGSVAALAAAAVFVLAC